MTAAEIIRRQRLGDLRRLLRHRYGPVLPDDDAGSEDLMDSLKPISLGPRPITRMRHEIELIAPWAGTDSIIDQVSRLPTYERKPKAKPLGQQMQVTNAEREALRLWTIAPADKTDEEMATHRKAKERARQARRRRERGAKPRAAYLAASLSRAKPWEAEGISRRTYYRRKGGTGPSEAKVNKLSTHLCHAGSRTANGEHGNGVSGQGLATTTEAGSTRRAVGELACQLRGCTCANRRGRDGGHRSSPQPRTRGGSDDARFPSHHSNHESGFTAGEKQTHKWRTVRQQARLEGLVE